MYNECTSDGCDDVAEEQRLVVSEDRPGAATARWFCRRHAAESRNYQNKSGLFSDQLP
jgi:hypothetical protein